MLEKLYSLECLNLEKLVLTYSKKLGISNDEVIVLLSLANSLRKSDKIKESQIAKNCGFDELFVSNTLARFMDLNLIGFVFSLTNGIGEGKYTISPLFEQLENVMKDDNAKADNTDSIIEYLENKLLRTLSGSEIERIYDWKDDGISLDDVEKACKKLEDKGYNLTVIRIEKAIYQIDAPKKNTKRVTDLLGK